MDSKLSNTIEEFGIANKAGLNSNDSLGDFLSGTTVPQTFEPITE